MEIRESSVMVTGGASGLGAACARHLAELGARVTIIDLQEGPGTELANEIGGAYAHTDVTDEKQVIAAIEVAMERGPLRGLVACAGIAGPTRTIGRDGRFESAYALEDFVRIVSVNLTGTFNCVRLAATAMSRNTPDGDGHRGVIVATSSVAATEGQVAQSAYAASKAGVEGMVLPLARDLASAGIRVNAIAPGLFETPFYDIAADAENIKQNLLRDVLFPKRFGLPEEFAALVGEMMRNDYMNAQVVRLDGGVRLTKK
jgi:NAD(P)-dependent dehydrogenase (short-subunit alcohol dehydrogenase family)